jgi:hypothetical protein
MKVLRYLVLATAVVALGLYLASGPGTRMGLWDWRMGLTLFRWAFYVGAGAAAVALVLLAIPRTRGPRPFPPCAGAPLRPRRGHPGGDLPVARQERASDPRHHHRHARATRLRGARRATPRFAQRIRLRRARDRGLATEGLPRYPVPRRDGSARESLRARARRRARHGLGDRAADAAAGASRQPIQPPGSASRTTSSSGCAPESAGSRIDIRSVSRVGRSDVGANAARIRALLEKLKP